MTKIDLELRPGQSLELLKELHILTRDGKINQDSRRKLKQVYHLYQFIEPLLNDLVHSDLAIKLADMGAGKSYLGFIINDLFLKHQNNSHVYAIETRQELVTKSQELAKILNFTNMSFLPLSNQDSLKSNMLPNNIQMVTALHACDRATDEAITFALEKKAKHIVLVPCCQAEVAGILREKKSKMLSGSMVELFRHSLHTREFGSHLTNVLRCLWLESKGYQVTVTELVGWEHSMKNELIIATYKNLPGNRAQKKLEDILVEFNLESIQDRYFNNSFS